MQRQIALNLAHSLMKARHLEREEALKLAWQVARADKRERKLKAGTAMVKEVSSN